MSNTIRLVTQNMSERCHGPDYMLLIGWLFVGMTNYMGSSQFVFMVKAEALARYANEVGESFRALIHVYWVRLSYLTASGYVVADSIHKGYLTSQKSFPKPAEKTTHVSVSIGDTLVWQGLASVAIPGLTINRICTLTSSLLKRTTNLPSPVRKWTTTAVGLACIPFIISPIDRSVDHLMDKFVRPYYPVKTISDTQCNSSVSQS